MKLATVGQLPLVSLSAKILTTAFAALAISLPLAATSSMLAPQPARSEADARSCSDCPSYSGAFSISNSTGQTIHYQMRWGTTNAWKSFTLENGRIKTHSYPMGTSRNTVIPIPYVRFDAIGQTLEYWMQFHAVGYAGYGTYVDPTQPKRYHFKYTPDGQHLNLFSTK
jgi:hypothetical protein